MLEEEEENHFTEHEPTQAQEREEHDLIYLFPSPGSVSSRNDESMSPERTLNRVIMFSSPEAPRSQAGPRITQAHRGRVTLRIPGPDPYTSPLSHRAVSCHLCAELVKVKLSFIASGNFTYCLKPRLRQFLGEEQGTNRKCHYKILAVASTFTLNTLELLK